MEFGQCKSSVNQWPLFCCNDCNGWRKGGQRSACMVWQTIQIGVPAAFEIDKRAANKMIWFSCDVLDTDLNGNTHSMHTRSHHVALSHSPHIRMSAIIIVTQFFFHSVIFTPEISMIWGHEFRGKFYISKRIEHECSKSNK